MSASIHNPARDSDSTSWAARARRVAKSLIPKRVLQEIIRYRKFKPHERPLYLRLRLFDGFGLRKPSSRKVPTTARSFLFICFGNIMRSPMCEALMKRSVANVADGNLFVNSAGLNATPGTPAHPWGVIAARDFGIDLSDHRSRLVNLELLDQADAIFAMDYQNQVELLCRYPAIRHKVFMLSAYAGEGHSSVEIRDPFYGNEDGTRECYRILQNCVNNLVATLAIDAGEITAEKKRAVPLTAESPGSR